MILLRFRLMLDTAVHTPFWFCSSFLFIFFLFIISVEYYARRLCKLLKLQMFWLPSLKKNVCLSRMHQGHAITTLQQSVNNWSVHFFPFGCQIGGSWANIYNNKNVAQFSATWSSKTKIVTKCNTYQNKTKQNKKNGCFN